MHGKAFTVDCSPARLVLGVVTKRSISNKNVLTSLKGGQFYAPVLNSEASGSIRIESVMMLLHESNAWWKTQVRNHSKIPIIEDL